MISLKKNGAMHHYLQTIPKERCILYEGIKEHKFGMWLTKAERRWIITELANFIVEQYPRKNKEEWLRDIWKRD